MEIIMVAAMSANGVLGKDNRLLWTMPADLVHYHNLVRGQWVIMGRRTFESHYDPVPYQQGIIITRNPQYQAEGHQTATSLRQAVAIAAEQGQRRLYVLGGGEIYQAMLPFAHQVVLTIIQTTVEGDTFFPHLPAPRWQLTRQYHHAADLANPYPYTFCFYENNAPEPMV